MVKNSSWRRWWAFDTTTSLRRTVWFLYDSCMMLCDIVWLFEVSCLKSVLPPPSDHGSAPRQLRFGRTVGCSQTVKQLRLSRAVFSDQHQQEFWWWSMPSRPTLPSNFWKPNLFSRFFSALGINTDKWSKTIDQPLAILHAADFYFFSPLPCVQ